MLQLNVLSPLNLKIFQAFGGAPSLRSTRPGRSEASPESGRKNTIFLFILKTIDYMKLSCLSCFGLNDSLMNAASHFLNYCDDDLYLQRLQSDF